MWILAINPTNLACFAIMYLYLASIGYGQVLYFFFGIELFHPLYHFLLITRLYRPQVKGFYNGLWRQLVGFIVNVDSPTSGVEICYEFLGCFFALGPWWMHNQNVEAVLLNSVSYQPMAHHL